MPRTPQEHWNLVYDRNSDHQVGWYQEDPITSKTLIHKYSPSKGSSILDIGSGNSNLCRSLILDGYSDITLVDIAKSGIERSKSKLEGLNHSVSFIEGDVLELQIDRQFDLIHDRAVFHFLWDEGHIERYVQIISTLLKQGGHFVIGAFAMDGPEKCSGLPVNRQSFDSLSRTFNVELHQVESFAEDHQTPSGALQKYIFVVFRKKG